MGKIIIHNKHDKIDDATATQMVAQVMAKGFISGDRQYCWLTHWASMNAVVAAERTRGDTHTFKVLSDD